MVELPLHQIAANMKGHISGVTNHTSRNRAQHLRGVSKSSASQTPSDLVVGPHKQIHQMGKPHEKSLGI